MTVIRVVLIAPRSFEEAALIDAFLSPSNEFIQMEPVHLEDRSILRVFTIDSDFGVVICGLNDGQGQFAARNKVQALLACDDSRLQVSLILLCGTAGAHPRLRDNDGISLGAVLYPISVMAYQIAAIGENTHKLRGPTSIPEEILFIRPIFSFYRSIWIENTKKFLNSEISISGADFSSSAVKICNTNLANQMVNVGGIEADEMEFLGLFEAVKGKNIKIDLIKGISDFIEHNEKVEAGDKHKAARNSAAATVALLSIPRLRAEVAEFQPRKNLDRRRPRNFDMMIQKIYDFYKNASAAEESLDGLRGDLNALSPKIIEDVCRELDDMFGHVCGGCGKGLKQASRVLANTSGIIGKLEEPNNPIDVPQSVIRVDQLMGYSTLDSAPRYWLTDAFAHRVMSFQPNAKEAGKYRSLLQTLLHFRFLDSKLALKIADRLVAISESEFSDNDYLIISALLCRLCVSSRDPNYQPSALERDGSAIRQQIEASSLPPKEKSNRMLELDQRVLLHKVLVATSGSKVVSDAKKHALCSEIDRCRMMRQSGLRTPNAWILGLSYLRWIVLKDADSKNDLISIANDYISAGAQMYHCLYDIGLILKTSRELESLRI